MQRFFGDASNGCFMVTLEAGQTAFIPSGLPLSRAVAAPESRQAGSTPCSHQRTRLCLAGTFCTRPRLTCSSRLCHIRQTQILSPRIRCAEIESHLGVVSAFRYPNFGLINVYAARHLAGMYAERTGSVAHNYFGQRVPIQDADLPADAVRQLLELSRFIRAWADDSEEDHSAGDVDADDVYDKLQAVINRQPVHNLKIKMPLGGSALRRLRSF